MKARLIFLIGLIMVIFSGCLVKSLHPFYKEGDVEFDNELLGTWLDEDSITWRINPYMFSKGFMKGDSIDNSYLVEMFEDSSKVSKFNVHLFGLDGNLYLDFAPIWENRFEEIIDFHLVPAHSIARIKMISNTEVVIAWYEEEWLDKLFKENKVKISHEIISTSVAADSKEYVLTASTDELQKFIIKYGGKENAYLCDEKNNNFMCTYLTKVQ